MKLRNITQHLKQQNWFEVIVDIIIVILGVLIAVQIGNTNHQNQQKQIYIESIDRVITELKDNISQIEYTVERLHKQLPVVQLGLESLRACQSDAIAKSQIEQAFSSLNSDSSFRVDGKALEQLIGNDDFLIFQSAEIRKALLALSKDLDGINLNSDSVKQKYANVFRELSHIIQPGPLLAKGPNEIVDIIRKGKAATSQLVRKWAIVAPLKSACKDPALLAWFYKWEDSAYYHSVIGRFNVERLESYLKKLSEELTKLQGQN